jgi:hypothetical protein
VTKIAESEAKSKLCQSQRKILSAGTSTTEICATYAVFKNLPTVKNRPKGQKFAQSGHPGGALGLTDV